MCCPSPMLLLLALFSQEAGVTSFGNGSLRLTFSAEGRLAALANALTNETIRLDSAGFAIALQDGTEVEAGKAAFREEQLPPHGGRAGGRKLTATAEVPARGLRIVAAYEARDGEHWIEHFLELRGAERTRLARVTLARWKVPGAVGPPGPGTTVQTLGYPSGCGQLVYLRDFFAGIPHPGAENFASADGIECGIPACDSLEPGATVSTKRLVIGAGGRGLGRRAFIRYLHDVRAQPQRMVFLINDWYWKDKSRPLEDLRKLVAVKKRTGVPIDSFTLDDGWSTYTDSEAGLWGKLLEDRFPYRWDDLVAAGAEGDIDVSLWFGPIGGYGYRPKRIPLARELGFEINGDKLCLAGSRYGTYVRKAFAEWARKGMDYIKVDGFWPDCAQPDHGHPTGPGGAIAQMDALCETFRAWRSARPDLTIAYTSGSNPSPFWLLHCDYVWRSGADDAHLGAGGPFDRYATFVDSCLEQVRGTEMPVSAFVVFDAITRRMLPGDDAALRRGFWWLAARTSLNHDWYLHPEDMDAERWEMLAEAARWARKHESEFPYARMIGGDPRSGEIYGFACFDGTSGTLALRNPGAERARVGGTLADWLELSPLEKVRSYRVTHAFGSTGPLAGVRKGEARLEIELSGLDVAVVEVTCEP